MDPLGSVPNRGREQADIFLNGVPYLQSISDVTDPLKATPIHLEPGIWVIVPPTTDPAESVTTVARMASIPHGTTINAQGTIASIAGGPASGGSAPDQQQIPLAPVEPARLRPSTPLGDPIPLSQPNSHKCRNATDTPGSVQCSGDHPSSAR